jgi:RND superfamily putative drug exporter
MSALASFVSGRRTKWAVLGLWIVVLVVLAPLGAELADETQDDTESFLPASAESTEVVRLLDDEFESGETTQGLIVYERDGGLSTADKQKIQADAKAVEALPEEDLPLTRPPLAPFGPLDEQAIEKSGEASTGEAAQASAELPQLVSPEGSVAYTVLTVPTNFEESADWGKDVRDVIEEDQDEGLTVLLSGDLGFSADAEEVFGELDTKLLLASVVLVLVLLGAIYRSVLVALTPIIVVAFAYNAATGFVYLLAKSGATVSSTGTSILIVLMFGVGTDYCLLLVSRYREELRRFED